MARYLIGIMMFGLMALAGTSSSYMDSIKAWQEHRNAGLRKPDSWLALVGLYWLNPGDNTIGSMGKLHVDGDKVTYNSKALSYDEDKPDVIKVGSVSFYVIKRGERYAVRAKDSESATLKNFQGVTFFDVNPALHFEARLIPDVKKIPILNVMGETEMEESPGIVEFTYLGQTRHLRPIYEGKTLFFLFRDATNKESTYQAGRMLNTPLAVDGKVDLDFNRAYNPPCTFTPYATCPLAPRENQLPFAVEAGEKRYGKGHVELPAS